jgi:hypothetical protein
LEDFQFTDANAGFSSNFLSSREGDEPIHFYKLFVDYDVLSLIVEETNKYAAQKIVSGITNETLKKHSMITRWNDTDRSEILAFLGYLMWMGLDRKPRLKDYFSSNMLYRSDVNKKVGMSRIRFELLLANIHFSDNEHADNGNRLCKI